MLRPVFGRRDAKTPLKYIAKIIWICVTDALCYNVAFLIGLDQKPLMDLEPEALQRWLVDISFSFREQLISARSISTKSFVLKAKEYVCNNYADEELSLDDICTMRSPAP